MQCAVACTIQCAVQGSIECAVHFPLSPLFPVLHPSVSGASGFYWRKERREMGKLAGGHFIFYIIFHEKYIFTCHRSPTPTAINPAPANSPTMHSTYRTSILLRLRARLTRGLSKSEFICVIKMLCGSKFPLSRKLGCTLLLEVVFSVLDTRGWSRFM